MSDFNIELGKENLVKPESISFEFMSNNVEEVEEVIISSCYNDVEINPKNIEIEITGLKTIDKFIGLQDTPLYYENGKFFKVEGSKIVYADLQWSDITGKFSENPELVEQITELISEVSEDFVIQTVNNNIAEHNQDANAHQSIRENIETLDNKIELNKIDTNSQISNIELKIQNNSSDINSINEDIIKVNDKINDLTLEIGVDIRGEISQLQNDLTSANEHLNDEISRIDTVIQNNDTNINSLLRETASDLKNNIDLNKQLTDVNINNLTNTVEQNYNTLNSNISDLSQDIEQNYNTLDSKIDTTNTNLKNSIDIKANKANTLDGYGITDAYTKTEIDGKISSVFRYKGSVNTYDDLPESGQVIGDVYNILDTGSNYAWDGTKWDKLSETVDLSPYLTKQYAKNIYETIENVNALSTVVQNNYNILDTKIDNTKNSILGDVNTLNTKVNTNYTTLDTKINTINTQLENGINELDITVSENFSTLSKYIVTNKEAIVDLTNDLKKYSKTSEFANVAFTGEYQDLKNIPTNIATNEYVQQYVKDAVSKIQEFSFVVVDQLPTTGESHYIYLVSHYQDSINYYDEYIWISDYKRFELIGSTQIDLSNYYTKDEIDTLKQNKLVAGTGIEITEDNVINNTQTSAEWGNIEGDISSQTDLQNLFDTKVDKVEGKSLISDTEIERLSNVTNYDDTNILIELSDLQMSKQDKLTAGTNISITDNTISTIDVDTTTIQVENNTITTIGQKTKNGDVKYEWFGTLAEYEAGISDGSITADMECRIIDDEEFIIVNIPVANTTTIGLIKPDGNTVTVDEDGTLHSIGGNNEINLNYPELTNKPKINGVELVGDLTTDDLGISTGGAGGEIDTSNLVTIDTDQDITGIKNIANTEGNVLYFGKDDTNPSMTIKCGSSDLMTYGLTSSGQTYNLNSDVIFLGHETSIVALKGGLTIHASFHSPKVLYSNGIADLLDTKNITTQNISSLNTTNKTIVGAINELASNNTSSSISIIDADGDEMGWYRIWSNGWCEQGGVITSNINHRSAYTLIKNFRNNYYSAWASAELCTNSVGTSNMDLDGVDALPIDNTSFKLIGHSAYGVKTIYAPIFWKAWGFISNDSV